MTGTGGGARRRWRGIRVSAACAIVLLVLLTGHHPLMGLMPDPSMSASASGAMSSRAVGSSLPTQGSEMLSTASVSGADDATGDGCCLTCRMVCPLMDATMPDRSAFLSPTSHPQRGVVSSSPSPLPVPGVIRARYALAQPTGHIPKARRRRALLRVYLL